MSSNFYWNAKASEMHRQQLLREADQQRLLAQLPRHHESTGRHIGRRFSALLLWLSSRLKRFEQKMPTMLEDRP